MLSFHKNDVQSVAVGVSKLDVTGLILVDSGVWSDEICYSGTTDAACQISSETVLQCTDRAGFLTLIFHRVV